MRKITLTLLSLFFLFQISNAQSPTPQERAVQLSATTQVSPPQINLQWESDPSATQYVVHRKGLNDTDWGSPIATLPGSATSYTDVNVQVGIGYEYAFFKEDFQPRIDVVCIDAGTQVELLVTDAFGIGLCCSFGQGFYEVTNCGNVVAYGDDFGFSESTVFTVCNSGSGCTDVTIKVKPDMIENSTYWTLKNVQTGQQLASGGAPGTFIRPRPEYGFIYAGINLPPIEDRGRVLLVIEDGLVNPLSTELAELRTDMIKDGWKVSTRTVNKNDAVSSVKNVIQNVYNSQSDLNAVLLLGDVPVAYSGAIFPDTHIENKGAYPADAYYGEMNGTWTDQTVNTTAPFLNIYHNVPGDGRFDQDFPPSGVVELQVGRVDLSNMPAFSQNETQLIQQYLNRNHDFKIKAFDPVRRGLVDDNFNQSIAAPAATAYRNFSTMFGANNVFDLDYISTMSSNSYLWSYGCGSGNANTALGVGTINDFANSNLNNVFTMLFGSQFGNWEFTNSLLKAPLATGNTLTSCWAGNPPWSLHHMSMGYNIGYSLLQTQNNTNDEYLPAGAAPIHVSLLGDPTLRMHMVKAPTNIQVSSTSNSVNLNWLAASESSVAGYYIYRASSLNGDFQRINSSPITGTSYTDNSPMNGENVYQIKTLKLESSGSGTYYNLSLGALDSLSFSGTGGGDTTPPTASLNTGSNNVNAAFQVSISFSENIVGLSESDFQITNGNVSNLSGSGSTFSITITPLIEGSVSVYLPNQSYQDQAGNLNVTNSNTITVNYTTNTGGGCNNPTNLALNKSTSQIGTQQNGISSRAVDGNTDGNFWANQSVSLTNWTNQAWWQVDLGSESEITDIKIWNRTDCCESILSNYYVFVSNNPFTSDDLNEVLAQSGVESFYQSGVAGLPSNVAVNTNGRYVRVQLAGQGFLAMAEVEVLGCSGSVNGGTNQTITFNSIPNKLTTDPSFNLNATASSGLQVSYELVSGPASISGNTISLNGNPGTVTVRASQPGNSQFNAAPNVEQSFSITEPNTGGCSTVTNVAIGKTATQSPTQFNADASRAVDGNTSGNFWGTNSTTLTNWSSESWWEVDLGASMNIESINIWNREDCCTDIFSNYYVFVSDVPFNSSSVNGTVNQSGVDNYFQNTIASRPSEIAINRTGRYVRVQLQGQGFLAIAEVEVMGCTNTIVNRGSTNTLVSSVNDLLEFHATKQGRGVNLKWVTNMSMQSDYFILEKSYDGIDFEFWKEVENKGNSNNVFAYLEKDDEPNIGMNYYRLISVMKDGSEIYSPIYEVEFKLDLDELVVFPNPAEETVFINLKKHLGEDVIIQIYDSRGILQKEKNIQNISSNLISFDLKNFNNGLYLISIKVNESKIITKKLMIGKLY